MKSAEWRDEDYEVGETFPQKNSWNFFNYVRILCKGHINIPR